MIALLFSFLLFPWSHWSFACHIEGLADGKLVLIVPSAAAILLPLLLTARQLPVHQFSLWSSPQGSDNIKFIIDCINTAFLGFFTIKQYNLSASETSITKKMRSLEKGFRIDTVAQFFQLLIRSCWTELIETFWWCLHLSTYIELLIHYSKLYKAQT